MSHDCPGPCGGSPVGSSKLLCSPCWRLVPRSLQNALYRAWDRGKGRGSAAHREAMRAVVQSVSAPPEPAPKPTPFEPWEEAGEDPERYRQLMREHGHLIGPDHPEYETTPKTLPCGWPGPQRPDWDPDDG
jgi:hypothetical protein